MNSNEDLELFFYKISAPFWKRFLATFLDLLLLIFLTFPIAAFCFHIEFSSNWYSSWISKIFTSSSAPSAVRCLIFSLILFIVFYLYFVFIPTKNNHQTIFSYIFGIKLVELKKNFELEEKLSQKKLFFANLIPVFSMLIINILFFGIAGIAGKNSQWTNIFKSTESSNTFQDALLSSTRILISTIFLLQIYYLFSVSMSKKINWLVKYFGVIEIDIQRYLFLLKKADKLPVHKKIKELEREELPVMGESIVVNKSGDVNLVNSFKSTTSDSIK